MTRRTNKRTAIFRTSPLKRIRSSSFSSSAFLASCGDGRTALKFRKNQRLFAQGGTADAIYYIQKGRIKITVTAENGKEAVLALVDKGEFCGEACLGGQLRHTVTALAFTDCDVTRIEKDAVMRTVKKQPAFAAFFLEHCLRRTIRLQEDLVDQLFNCSEKRLARVLLTLAKLEPDGTSEPFKISQEMLAEMIGTTRSRVSFFMNRFREQGLISYNGTVTIHDALLRGLLDRRSSPPSNMTHRA